MTNEVQGVLTLLLICVFYTKCLRNCNSMEVCNCFKLLLALVRSITWACVYQAFQSPVIYERHYTHKVMIKVLI